VRIADSVRLGGCSIPMMTVYRWTKSARAGERLANESDGDGEAHLADRQGERPQRLVVVVG